MRFNRTLTVGLYCVAALLVILPAVDTILAMLPAHPATLAWRFGAEGVLASNLITPLFGWALLLALVLTHGHRRVLRALAALSAAAALVLLIVALLGTLDALQLRGQVRPDRLLRFDVAALETVAKTTLMGGTLLILGMGAWKAGRKRRTQRVDADDAMVLAVPPLAEAFNAPRRSSSSVATLPGG